MKAAHKRRPADEAARRQSEMESAQQELGVVGARVGTVLASLAALPQGARRPVEVKLRLAVATLRQAASEVEETLRHLAHALALESLQELPEGYENVTTAPV